MKKELLKTFLKSYLQIIFEIQIARECEFDVTISHFRNIFDFTFSNIVHIHMDKSMAKVLAAFDNQTRSQLFCRRKENVHMNLSRLQIVIEMNSVA